MELLADQHLEGLGPEDAAELEGLLRRAEDVPDVEGAVGELLVAFDAARDGGEMPAALRARLIAAGPRVERREVGAPIARANDAGAFRFPRWMPLAASVALLVGAVALSGYMMRERSRAQGRLDAARQQLAALEQQVENNRVVLASAQAQVDELVAVVSQREESIAERDIEIARAAERELAMAQRLAAATEDLSQARLAIARYETPADPEELAANRRKLLDFPDTVRIGWAPFDLPENPAEKQGVSGDVVWNDQMQQGYLRFVGLDANDPNVEQYQVWIIDDRGMEQKVSGGVFNASADGEIVVPITPGIDVRRVALFAVTIEEPGGTWVPDLRRRVVVAPRDGG